MPRTLATAHLMTTLRARRACLVLALLLIPSLAHAYSEGPAAIGTVDGTGSPRSGGSCSQCHGRETMDTQVSVTLYDAMGSQPSGLQGGDAYIVELRVANDDYAKFGAQLSAHDASGGISSGFFFGGGENPETQISEVFGQQFMENDGRSDSGVFRAWWTAPTDQREVVFHFSGLAVNGTGRGGDEPSFPSSRSYEVEVECIDVDADTLCDNIEDMDDDNDGVSDGEDRDPTDPSVCSDLDGDGCDDCAVGSDGLGPMSDQRVDADGDDGDGDGLCDVTDYCRGDNLTGDIDSDGVCGDLDLCIGDDALGDLDGDGVCGGSSQMDMGNVSDMETVDLGFEDMFMGLEDMGVVPGTMHDMHGGQDAGIIKEPVSTPPGDGGGCQSARSGSPGSSCTWLALFALLGITTRRRVM